MLPAALEIAMEEDTELRRGLPLDYLTYMGVQNSDKVTNHLLPVNISCGFSNFEIKLCMYHRTTQDGKNSFHKLRL